MKKITVDLSNIQTPGGMHAYLAFAMDFPAHYGRNLDALHDQLTEISEPMQLCIRRPALLSPEMTAFFPRLSLMLHDVQEENECLEIFFELTN